MDLRSRYEVPPIQNGTIPRFDNNGDGPIYGNVQGGMHQVAQNKGHDSVDAKLRAGEYVLRPESVQALGGVQEVNKLNALGGPNRPQDFGDVPKPNSAMPNMPLSEITKKDRYGGSITMKFDTKAEKVPDQQNEMLWNMINSDIPKPQSMRQQEEQPIPNYQNGGSVHHMFGGGWLSGLFGGGDEEDKYPPVEYPDKLLTREEQLVDINANNQPDYSGIANGPATQGVIQGIEEAAIYAPPQGTDENLLQSSSQNTQVLQEQLGSEIENAQNLDMKLRDEANLEFMQQDPNVPKMPLDIPTGVSPQGGADAFAQRSLQADIDSAIPGDRGSATNRMGQFLNADQYQIPKDPEVIDPVVDETKVKKPNLFNTSVDIDKIQNDYYTAQAQQNIDYLKDRLNNSTDTDEILNLGERINQEETDLEQTLTNISDAKAEQANLSGMTKEQLEIQEAADAAGVSYDTIIENKNKVLDEKLSKANAALANPNTNDQTKKVIEKHIEELNGQKANVETVAQTPDKVEQNNLDKATKESLDIQLKQMTGDNSSFVDLTPEEAAETKSRVDAALTAADNSNINPANPTTGNPQEDNWFKSQFSGVFKDLFGSGAIGEALIRGLVLYAGGRLTGMSGNQALALAAKDALNQGAAEKKALADRQEWAQEGFDPEDYVPSSVQLYTKTGNLNDLVRKPEAPVSFGSSAGYDVEIGAEKFGVFHDNNEKGQYVDLFKNGIPVDLNAVRQGRIADANGKPINYSVKKWNPENSPEKLRTRYINDAEKILKKTGIDLSETNVDAVQVGNQLAAEGERIRQTHPHLSATAVQEQITKSMRQYGEAVRLSNGEPPSDAAFFLRANMIALDLDKVRKMANTDPERIINTESNVNTIVSGLRSNAINNNQEWSAVDSENARNEVWTQFDAAWQILNQKENKYKLDEWKKRAKKSPILTSPYMAFVSDFLEGGGKGPSASFILANNEAIDKLTTQKFYDIQK